MATRCIITQCTVSPQFSNKGAFHQYPQPKEQTAMYYKEACLASREPGDPETFSP